MCGRTTKCTRIANKQTKKQKNQNKKTNDSVYLFRYFALFFSIPWRYGDIIWVYYIGIGTLKSHIVLVCRRCCLTLAQHIFFSHAFEHQINWFMITHRHESVRYDLTSHHHFLTSSLAKVIMTDDTITNAFFYAQMCTWLSLIYVIHRRCIGLASSTSAELPYLSQIDSLCQQSISAYPSQSVYSIYVF